MDIKSKEFNRIVRKIARINETDPEIVRDVIISQFECARANMKRADHYNDFFPYIKLPYLFTFKVLPGKRNFFVKKAKKIIDDVYSESGQSDN